MKKICILLVISIFFSGCSDKNNSGKVIILNGVGSFTVPQEWIYTKENDVIYFTDQPINKENSLHTFYAIGIVYDVSENLDELSQSFGKKILYKELVFNEVFSNSAMYGKGVYSIDSKLCEKLFLDFYPSERKLFLLVLNDSISSDTIKDIAKSFTQVNG